MMRASILVCLAICFVCVKAGQMGIAKPQYDCYDKVTKKGYTFGEDVPRKDPCTTCRCESGGFVLCKAQSCLLLDHCKEQYTPDNECCPVCKYACVDKKGIGYNDGDDVPTGNPCEFCHCDGGSGKIICAMIGCALPPCQNHYIPEGECCPVCKACEDKDGNVYSEGDDVPTGDPCMFCHCATNGQIVCASIDCLAPSCEKQYTPKDKCCSVCTVCEDEDGNGYSEGDPVPSPSDDPCELCHCDASGEIMCFIRDCPRPQCENYFVPDGECCPECNECEAGDGTVYQPDEIVPCKDPCLQCICHGNGKIKCDPIICPRPNCKYPVEIAGKCCPVCSPTDCSGVLCAIPKCKNAYVPEGQCCPECPDCSKVSCLRIKCLNEIWVPGQCCSKCGPTDCSTIRCPPLKCPIGSAYVPEGECCPVCPDCTKAICLAVYCENEIWIPGECCPRCGPPDCSLVDCMSPTCKGAYTPKGLCCPICPDCLTVRCGEVKCPNAYIPKGKCCPVCPDCSKVPCPLIKCFNEIWVPGQCCPQCGPDCRTVRCAGVKCPNAYVPKGKCCPVCPDCSKVLCPLIKCVNEIWVPGQCCPRCGPVKTCENGLTPLPNEDCGGFLGLQCPSGYLCDHSNDPPNSADYFGICCKDCRTVKCGEVKCPNAYVPIGECCPVCPVKTCSNNLTPLAETDCGGIAGLQCPPGYLCDHSNDPPGSADFFGICCRDCSNVKCADPGCDDAFVPEGDCCPICPDAVCELPPVVGPCEAIIPRYFYNKKTGKCEKFNYGGCDGNANNFELLSECQSACNEDAVCELPPVVGPCEAEIPRYFYNKKTGKCEKFNYGGCDGNANNFNLLSECQSTCNEVAVCEQPKVVGPCDAVIPRYFYNKKSGQCEAFDYGGCEGNDNNFKSLYYCQTACQDVCDLPKYYGTCKASIPRYFYNKKAGECELFYYGGCHANGNNFETLSECQSRCPNVCNQPKKPGPCKAYFPRYFFNSATQTCEQFIYGGCQANDNNFLTLADCQTTCPTVCNQPKKPGPCKAYFPRYFFNSVTQTCEQFIYGGCQANDNNFLTMSDCQTTCPTVNTCANGGTPLTDTHCGGIAGLRCPKGYKCEQPNNPNTADMFGICCRDCSNVKCANPGCNDAFIPEGGCCPICPDVCGLPKLVGRCRARIARYFFNEKTGKCELFYYGGCGGNGNNFETLSECQSTCPDVCDLSKDPGPCKGSFNRYYYNSATNTCDWFVYGGCDGNQNRFESEQDCQDTCVVNVCDLPKDPGPCKGSFNRYYYNSVTNTCDWFVYGGCDGNQNRFESQQDCQETCTVNACDLPKDPGPCKGSFNRYYYNSVTNTCDWFVYGGCDGNQNRFESQQDCQDTCTVNVCDLPKDPGPCKGSFNRYYYNSVTNTCDWFVYGGCDGNQNRFESQQDCQDTCTVNVCDLPKAPGPCKGSFNRYYYNSVTNTCEWFVYGGCDGNQNRFESEQDCLDTCNVNVCDLPVVPGPCYGSFPSYYYDAETKTCGKFIYGGCGGNGNRFELLEDCHETCNVTGCYDESGTFYEFGADVPSSDPCNAPCVCAGSGKIVCATVDCLPLDCKYPVHPKGKCCPVCPKTKFCKHKSGKVFKIGSNVPSGDPCVKCTCEEGGVIQCVSMICEDLPCPNPIYTKGKCCPKCPKVCKHTDGKLYKIGKNVPSDDPCEKCRCDVDGLVKCVTKICDQLPCPKPIYTKGKCCPKCPKVCKHTDGKTYKVGRRIPSKDPCTRCRCEKYGEVVCVSMSCYVPCEDPIYTPGICCPKCPKVCKHTDGQIYNFGQMVPAENPCSEECKCTRTREVVCTKVAMTCPTPTCKHPTVVDGQCCPICPRACRQPKKPGLCKGSFPRFFYNTITKQCESFIYCGCLGNKNRFMTLQDCKDTCVKLPPACTLPKVAGPCKGSFHRYYYNKKTGECEKFIYGGCSGNKNNFKSLEKCMDKCVAT